MATYSFLRGFKIKTKNEANCFIKAVESSENDNRTMRVPNKSIKTLNKSDIKEIFGE
jgi:hypothetical protein